MFVLGLFPPPHFSFARDINICTMWAFVCRPRIYICTMCVPNVCWPEKHDFSHIFFDRSALFFSPVAFSFCQTQPLGVVGGLKCWAGGGFRWIVGNLSGNLPLCPSILSFMPTPESLGLCALLSAALGRPLVFMSFSPSHRFLSKWI